MRLLVIEDDPKLMVLPRKGLALDGHVVDAVLSGGEGLARARSDPYDAVILDLSLADLDGLDVARRLRRDGSSVPVLMLTAREMLGDCLQGLSAGADDYLCKALRLRGATFTPASNHAPRSPPGTGSAGSGRFGS